MSREWVVEERRLVGAKPEQVYEAVADLRRMGEWSPECVGVWIRGSGPAKAGTRFVGWNRRGGWIWFTTCVVEVAEPGREFAFRVTSFSLPIATWGYRFAEVEAGTEITEYWADRRTGGLRAKIANLLGLIFTGTPAPRRAERNRAGMRATLGRIAAAFGD